MEQWNYYSEMLFQEWVVCSAEVNVINRPGVAGAVLKSPSSFIKQDPGNMGLKAIRLSS